ncbi:hypothetical protein [Candidatus Mycolicibacterium alkanivorans]|uniref:Uncharacterized protein n=1 Tax=Candidatus Mycolicibacterium alkanivorans TaxID=2954114 RepID=A0ABS9YTR4_9MYCO|nr:hypothetical protein [Candidatus Mycolicibacterium alkanivorans]MCI4674600.1 hypothetical protein [Candidatus Mycolicibacterium alkanivorans]
MSAIAVAYSGVRQEYRGCESDEIYVPPGTDPRGQLRCQDAKYTLTRQGDKTKVRFDLFHRGKRVVDLDVKSQRRCAARAATVRVTRNSSEFGPCRLALPPV